MDKVNKGKLKVLIKKILLEKSPRPLSANQIANIINEHKWGFQTPITSTKISKLLLYELKKNNKHFLDCIQMKKRGKTYVFYIPSKDLK